MCTNLSRPGLIRQPAPPRIARRAAGNSLGLWLVLGFLPPALDAQTIVAQNAVTTDTTISSALIATGGAAADGDLYKPTIAGTTSLHRDALFVTDGATLTLASGADVAVKNDDNLTTFLRVGYGDDKTGTLIIATGATLAVGQSTRYANFQIAEGQRSTGIVQQTGGAVTVKGSYNVGVNGGNGTYTLSGGTLPIDHDDNAANKTSQATIGFNYLGPGSEASSGTVNLSGGTLTVTAHQWDPSGHPGAYGSVALILGNRKTAATTYGGGNGTINQTGGVLHVDSPATFYLSSVGNGIYNLNGGTLEIGGASLQANYGNGGGSYAFNYGAGTIKVVGSALTTGVNLTLQRTDGGAASVFDTNGYDATLSGTIATTATGQTGTGGNGWVKLGTGTLNFTGASRAFNTFGVMGGTVAQSAGATTATEFMVGTGSGYTGAYVLNGGSITLSQTLNDGGVTTIGSMRTGDYGGTGTFTQNAGTVTINQGAAFHIGNQGGTGTYNLNGGTVTLIGNINVLGRSDPNKPASTGTLNVSSGQFTLQGADARLILGNNFSSAATSTGTINQTGGTVTVANGSYLYLAGYGNGTYNLNGGTLEIGGASLVNRYNNTTSTYALNLGGGTLKVTGSDLAASANATLAAGTTSTLNTNGLNAAWSGLLSGTGGLTKTGGGTLTLSHAANSFSGATTVGAGTLNLTGNLLNSAVTVGSGGTLRGSGSAAGVTVQSGGFITPGAGIGTFTVNGDLTLAAGSSTNLELSGLTRGSGYDYLTVANTFHFGGALNLTLGQGLNLTQGATFDLFDWGSASGTFATLNLPSPGASLGWDTSQLYSSGVLSVAAIPEPATIALLAGLGALGLALWRRRAA